jgi:hypothetical protein
LPSAARSFLIGQDTALGDAAALALPCPLEITYLHHTLDGAQAKRAIITAEQLPGFCISHDF